MIHRPYVRAHATSHFFGHGNGGLWLKSLPRRGACSQLPARIKGQFGL